MSLLDTSNSIRDKHFYINIGLEIWGKEYDLCDKVNGNKYVGLGILAWDQY